MKPPASHKPLCEQRVWKRKLFFSTHTKHVSASHSMHNPSFHIKAKSNIFFYIHTDIMSFRGEEEARIERKSMESSTGFFFFSPTISTHFIILQSLQPGRICILSLHSLFHYPSFFLNLSKMSYPSHSGRNESRHFTCQLLQTCSKILVATVHLLFFSLTPIPGNKLRAFSN